MSRRAPLVLCILDGWGLRDDPYGNAIAKAQLPNWHRMLERYPHTGLDASGEAVGLPAGVMGNSEVGHINIGSGRVVPQGLVVIDAAVTDGTFATNATLQQCITHVKASGGTLHLFGLLSDGRVHSSLDHLEALIDACAAANAPLAIDAFLDGRDTPPRSAQAYIDRISAYLDAHGKPGRFTSICGRYYAMDRDKRWERVEKAYAMLARSEGAHREASATAALEAAYARGENDEFVLPTIVGEPMPVADGDAVIFFNFRPDRGRELTLAFSGDGFNHFAVKHFNDLMFATMTRYEDEFPNPILFGPRPQSRTFGEIVSEAGLTQLRLAETEKYAHVT
jgi:2,3-bisphosphoglycerate-independent phosphoglycerate mutase